jgi:alpha-aminoadipate/glutamate carrier protein LysW
MPSCPECENDLDIELDEVEEGDVVACDECGTEYEIVGVEPLELSRVDDGLDEDDEEPIDEEEEEE